MKKNIANNLMKKSAAALLSLALAFSGAVLLPDVAGGVQAAGTEKGTETGTETKTYYTERFEDISKYTGSTRTAPKPTDKDHKDWIFAGWFMDTTCETFCEKTTGSACAKFVPAGVLSVKCQIQAGTSTGRPSDKLRVISTVDSLDYSKVGFDITVNDVTRSYESTKVYTEIIAEEGGVAVNYAPSAFHENAEYFLTGTLVNIPATAVSTPIQITPWWVTLDGTKVCGVGRYSRVKDFYDGICNIPIRLYSEEDVAAGYLEVAYDKDTFLYAGMDKGSVFEEMAVADADGVVSCVGNKRTITSADGNVKADGMYVNLRFQLKEGKSVSDGDTVFSVSAGDFCNNQETEKDVYVPNGVYRKIPNK